MTAGRSPPLCANCGEASAHDCRAKKRKRKPIVTADDAVPYIRAEMRRQLREELERSKALFVRPNYRGAGHYRLESKYSDDYVPGDEPRSPGFEFTLADVPSNARPLVAKLLELLDEQSRRAYLAVHVARTDLASDAGREKAREAIVDNRARAAEVHEKKLAARAHEVQRADGGKTFITDIARHMAREGFGT